jgi:hypothetical protein
LKLPFFIVGATARDILLQHAYGIRSIRATLDIDIGVFVSDWGQFQTLKETLMHTKRFSSTRQVHRLLFEMKRRWISFRSAALPMRTKPSHGRRSTISKCGSPVFRNVIATQYP